MAIRTPARTRATRWALALLACVGTIGTLGPAGGPAVADDRADPQSYREYDIGDGKVTFDVTEVPLGEVILQRIQPRTRVNIDVAAEAKDQVVSLRVVDLHWVHALSMLTERIQGAMVRKSPNLLRIERPEPVELQVENEDVSKVIRLIADYAGASVFISPEVKGQISVKLKNAPWRAALQYVVETAGKYSLVEGDYGMLKVVPTDSLELGNGTYVFRYLRPPPPYKGVVKAGNSSSGGSSSGGGTSAGSAAVGADIVESDVFIPSDDPSRLSDYFPIVAALRTIVAPEGGDVTYIPGSNAVLYTGTPPRIARVKALCEQLDVEPPQVFVDMNIVSTTNSDALNFGLSTDTGVMFSASGAGVLHRLPFAAGGAGWTDALTGSDWAAPNSANFSYGTLDFSQTNLLFQFLKQDQCSKVLQAPKLLALDNQEATIFIGESIRYARSTAATNQNGGLAYSVEEDPNSPVNVGFQLLVIPHVIPGENKVMLLVIPQQRTLSGTTSPIPGFDRFLVSGQTIDLPRVASRTLVTSMLLRDRETAVIGGLLEDQDVNGQDKLPLLGDLPILGSLFRGQQRSSQTRNIIITITPRILRGSDAANTTISDELSGRQERLKEEFGNLGAQASPASAPAPACPPPAPAPVPCAPR